MEKKLFHLRTIIFLILSCLLLFPANAALALPAFPGAEGFGAETVGGRGGRVIEVTNLNNSGTGSLRACVEASGPRICVFRTGGIIELQSTLAIANPYITIAGQTAPGGGITIRNNPANTGGSIAISGHDVVLRYLAVRPGPSQTQSSNVDALTIADFGGEVHNVIIDHCSFSWATDEIINTWYSHQDITIQWSIISEALRYSTHAKGEHSCGLLVGYDPQGVSVHHCLMAHNTMRNPEVGSNGGIVDLVNNVVYNPMWSGGAMGAYDNMGHVPINFIGNYLKAGPDTGSPKYVIWAPGDYGNGYSFYVNGNIGPTRTQDNQDQALAVEPGDRQYMISSRHDAPSITTTSAFEAYGQVLASVGANQGLDSQGRYFWRLDAVDERIINDVKNGTGRIINDPFDVGGWPTLASGTPYVDSDHDGMADNWERSYFGNLSRGSSGDSSGDYDGDGYTDLEEFLNGTNPGGGVPPLTGDLNNDGRVDIFDLVIVGTSFGRSPGQSGYDSRADANNSGGAIDIFDLILVGANFGRTS